MYRIAIVFTVEDGITEEALGIQQAVGITFFQERSCPDFYIFGFVPVVDCQVRAISVELVGQKNALYSGRTLLTFSDDKITFLNGLSVSYNAQLAIDYYVIADPTVFVVRRRVTDSHADIIQVVPEYADVITWPSTANQEWAFIVADVLFDKEVIYIRALRAVGVQGVGPVVPAVHYAI